MGSGPTFVTIDHFLCLVFMKWLHLGLIRCFHCHLVVGHCSVHTLCGQLYMLGVHREQSSNAFYSYKIEFEVNLKWLAGILADLLETHSELSSPSEDRVYWKLLWAVSSDNRTQNNFLTCEIWVTGSLNQSTLFENQVCFCENQQQLKAVS